MRQGLLPRQVAAASGLSRSYIQRLETGARTRMSPTTYAALRTALGLDPEDEQLLAPSEEPTEER
ncbi:helix-turn-helix domain-containing protein [Streptomyces sp. LZ34]